MPRKVEGSGKPGEVLSITDDGIMIAATDGAVLAKRVRPGKEAKVPAKEWADQAGLGVGDMCERAED